MGFIRFELCALIPTKQNYLVKKHYQVCQHGAISGTDGATSLMVNSMWADWGCIQNACDLFGPGMALSLLPHLVVNSGSS